MLLLERACLDWWTRFKANDRPCWLTLCGTTEVGKTHCADKLWRWATGIGRAQAPNGRSRYDPRKLWWPGFVNELRAGDAFDELTDTANWPLLFLDEIGASKDTSGFVADQLYLIIAQRENRWGILTTNLSIESLTTMDERIINRCTRNKGIMVEINTTPYGSRV